MRIIAGSLKGRRLAAFENPAIRPTSDRTRESIFNLLMHGQYGGDAIIGKNVADLCCGTGALGLEAISRGAHAVTFVDENKAALALAKSNALHCGVSQQCHFLLADVTTLPRALTPIALVLMDAPYALPIFESAYRSLCAQGWVQQGTLLVCELPQSETPPVLENASLRDSRRYGKATIHIYEVQKI